MENLKDMPVWYGAVWALLGLVLVLSGYRLMRLFARFASASLFGAIGLLVAAHFHLGPWISLGIAIGLGIAGFLAGNVFYFVNVFLNGAAAGYVLAGAIGYAAAGQASPAVSLIGVIAGGVLALIFERPIGIFGTSLIGAALLAVGLSAALVAAGAHAPGRLGWMYGALLILATVGGCILQARTTRDLPPPSTSRQPPREQS